MAKIIVTGVAGFIGSHIAARLVKDGHEVIGIDDLSAGRRENIPKGVVFEYRDVTEAHQYKALFDGAEAVFHNAASKKNICLANPARDMEVNGIGTLRLLTTAVDMGVEKFIHASTGSVYGEVKGTIHESTPKNPVSFYGVSKLAGENYVQLFSDRIKTTILRYFHVYGSRQDATDDRGGVVAIYTRLIKAGKQIRIHGDGSQKRVFTYVDDIVEANMKAWNIGGVYNCASSMQTTISELALMLMVRHGKVPVVYTDPLPGDIYNFYVNTDAIHKLGITFRPITKVI